MTRRKNLGKRVENIFLGSERALECSRKTRHLYRILGKLRSSLFLYTYIHMYIYVYIYTYIHTIQMYTRIYTYIDYVLYICIRIRSFSFFSFKFLFSLSVFVSFFFFFFFLSISLSLSLSLSVSLNSYFICIGKWQHCRSIKGFTFTTSEALARFTIRRKSVYRRTDNLYITTQRKQKNYIYNNKIKWRRSSCMTTTTIIS